MTRDRSSALTAGARRLGVWSEAELAELEREPRGGPLDPAGRRRCSPRRGEPLSEATFRKYVQLGLLPRSVRVGRKGKHRGSQGLYPASGRAPDRADPAPDGAGLHDPGDPAEFLFLGSDIEALARQLERGARRVVQRGASARDRER